MRLSDKIAQVASLLEERGLTKLADELDTLLDEILSPGSGSTDLFSQEPDSSGGTGPLMPSSMAADDGLMDDVGSDLVVEAPVVKKPVLSPEQEKDRMVKKITRKVMSVCEEQQFFKDVPRLMRELQLKKLTPNELHGTFKLQSKRMIQCAAELMNKLAERNGVELTEHDKLGMIRKMGLEMLDRCGCGQLKYDFVSAMAEYKNEGHTLS